MRPNASHTLNDIPLFFPKAEYLSTYYFNYDSERYFDTALTAAAGAKIAQNHHEAKAAKEYAEWQAWNKIETDRLSALYRSRHKVVIQEDFNDISTLDYPLKSHSSLQGVKGSRDIVMPKKHVPYSLIDFYENGVLKQRRYFGGDGYAIKDIDYFHNELPNSHTFPHPHYWDWTNKKNPRK